MPNLYIRKEFGQKDCRKESFVKSVSEKSVYTTLFAPGFCVRKDLSEKSLFVKAVYQKRVWSKRLSKRVFDQICITKECDSSLLRCMRWKDCRKQSFAKFCQACIRKEFDRKDCRKKSFAKSVSEKGVIRVFCVVCVEKIVVKSVFALFVSERLSYKKGLKMVPAAVGRDR